MSDMKFPHFNTRVGSQTFDPKYWFTEEGPLVETARGLYELGSDVLKISLSPELYFIKPDSALKSFKDVAAKEPSFRKVFDMPFKYYMLWVQPKVPEGEMALDLGMDKECEDLLYKEIYDLAVHFLCQYNDTGKVFLIGHWEGDWVLLNGYDTGKEADDSRIDGMIRNLAIRQKAVDDARINIPHKNVWVGHYAEVNRPLDAKDRKMKRMTNCVLPQVKLDLVSYSAYDSLWPNRITEALSYIEENSKFTAYFDGMFEKKVFIGEYDGYWDFVQHGFCSPEKQAENALTVISSGISWGAPFILYWEYYSNGLDTMEDWEGFWLIDRENQKQPVYYLHRDILAKINVFKNLYRYWLERNPKEQELNRAIGKLYKKPVSALVKELLDSEVYKKEIPDEKYVNKILFALFGTETTGSEMALNSIERCRSGGARFGILMDILDSSEFGESITQSEFIRHLQLDKRILSGKMSRSELWLYYLDRREFLLKELELRAVNDKNTSYLGSKYLFNKKV